jgi:hypothetical protein
MKKHAEAGQVQGIPGANTKPIQQLTMKTATTKHTASLTGADRLRPSAHKRTCLAASPAFAGSATWLNAPGSGDWNTNGNWNPATGVPNAAVDTATFGTSSITWPGQAP